MGDPVLRWMNYPPPSRKQEPLTFRQPASNHLTSAISRKKSARVCRMECTAVAAVPAASTLVAGVASTDLQAFSQCREIAPFRGRVRTARQICTREAWYVDQEMEVSALCRQRATQPRTGGTSGPLTSFEWGARTTTRLALPPLDVKLVFR